MSLATVQQQQVVSGLAVVPAPPVPDVGTPYQPTVHDDRSPSRIGTFTRIPVGVILHGSRSGIPGRSVDAEYDGTRRYARDGANGLGWNATIGNDAVSLHIATDGWGYNARAASDDYLAVEFAQANRYDPITDGQVRAFCWWLTAVARAQWPSLPENFPTHAEVEVRGETGVRDGKDDPFLAGDPRADELRERILATLSGARPVGYGWTREQVVEIIRQVADEAGIPAVLLLGLAVAESNLNVTARRPPDPADDRRYWGDVSMGLAQQTVRWSAEYLDWCRETGHDPATFPGSEVIERIGSLYYDPWFAARKAAAQLAGHFERANGDPLTALGLYNFPAGGGAWKSPAHEANYRNGLEAARRILGG